MIALNTQTTGIVYLKDKVNFTLTMTDVSAADYQRFMVYYIIDANTNEELSIPYNYEPVEGEAFTIDFQNILKALVYTPAPIVGLQIGTTTPLPMMYKKIKIRFEEHTFDKIECENDVTQTIESGEINVFNISHSYNSHYTEQFDSTFEVLNTKAKVIVRAGASDMVYDYVYIKTTIGSQFTGTINYYNAEGDIIGGPDNTTYNFTASAEVMRVCTYRVPSSNLARYAHITITRQGGPTYSYTIHIDRECIKKRNIMYLTQRGGYNYLTCDVVKDNYPTKQAEVYVRFENGVGGNTVYHKEATIEYDCELRFVKVDEENDITSYNEFIGSARYFIPVRDREDRVFVIECVCSNFSVDRDTGLIKFKLKHTLPIDTPNYTL